MRTPTKSGGLPPRLNPFRVALLYVKDMLLPQDITTRVVGAIRARDLPVLCALGKIEDREYQVQEMGETLALRQVAALFKKNEALSDDTRCSAKAGINFRRGELRCRLTNKRLDHFYANPDRIPPELRRQVDYMTRAIEGLLGDPSDLVGAMPSLIRLTNGATADRVRRRAMPFLKITGRLQAPRALIALLGKTLLSWGVDLSSCLFKAVEHNVISLVPKNWETHRTIAKEPTHALPFQLAADAYFKEKLRKWGINLQSQTKNQEMARKGSIDGSFATIDLEMASDTMAYNTVAWLLPLSWLRLLDSFRSSSYVSPWGKGIYAKYSSMGNGYTFTLETIIFTAACRAVGSRQYAVYGDDIVVETDRASALIKLLRFLGFRTNDAKSFINPESRFRESCGCDYFHGHFVTPWYLRELPKDSDRAGMSHVLNGLVSLRADGLLAEFAVDEVQRLGLRLVPWNSDTRSGVFITPHFAWQTKRLEVDTRLWLPKRNEPWPRSNPDYGFPVFDGYGVEQARRPTRGWRSLLLWHIQKSYEGLRPSYTPSNRTAQLLLELQTNGGDSGAGASPEVSYVVQRVRYVHKQCRYDPKPTSTPSHVYLFDDVVKERLPRAKARR